MIFMEPIDPLPEIHFTMEDHKKWEEVLHRLNRFFPNALCRELIIAEYDKISPKNLTELITDIWEMLRMFVGLFIFYLDYRKRFGSMPPSSVVNNENADLYDIECLSFRDAYLDWWAGMVWRYSTDSAWPEKRLNRYLLPEPLVGYSVHPHSHYFDFESHLLPDESVMKLSNEFAANIMAEVNNHPDGLVIFAAASGDSEIRIKKDDRGYYLDLGL